MADSMEKELLSLDVQKTIFIQQNYSMYRQMVKETKTKL